MIYKIFLKLYFICLIPFDKLSIQYHQLMNFVFPNFGKLIHNKHISLIDWPQFAQMTLISGAGNVKIGRNCSFGYKLGGFHRKGCIELQPRYVDSIIIIGDNIATNNNVMLCAANYIEIGDNTLIGQNVTIMDYEAHGINPDKRREIGEIGQVIIGRNVWIGNNVTILKNTVIGENTIVAAGAVVSGKFPSNVIIGGVPAKVIKNL